MREESRDDPQHRDKRFKPDITFLLNEQEKTRLKKEEYIRKTFKTRPIVHPKFENLSTDDAIKVIVAYFLERYHASTFIFISLILVKICTNLLNFLSNAATESQSGV